MHESCTKRCFVHVNPVKTQVPNFKSTVLCAPWEFSSGTGTVGKLCVSCFAFCTRFRLLFTFWLLFFTKRVDFPSEKHSIQVFDQFLISYSGAIKCRNTRKWGYELGILATSLDVPQTPTLPKLEGHWTRFAISTQNLTWSSGSVPGIWDRLEVGYRSNYPKSWDFGQKSNKIDDFGVPNPPPTGF